MGLKSAKILFNKPSSQRWDTSESKYILILHYKNTHFKNLNSIL